MRCLISFSLFWKKNSSCYLKSHSCQHLGQNKTFQYTPSKFWTFLKIFQFVSKYQKNETFMLKKKCYYHSPNKIHDCIVMNLKRIQLLEILTIFDVNSLKHRSQHKFSSCFFTKIKFKYHSRKTEENIKVEFKNYTFSLTIKLFENFIC